jgi:alkylation response protein AidB-like acyl-CoA dehydrogenase
VDGGAPGLAARPLETMAALPVCDLRLEATPAVLLGEEGRGVRLVLRALGALRPGAAGAACGLAARALETTVRHTLTRRQYGRPLAGFQATKMAIADMHAIEAARRLRSTPPGWPTEGRKRPPGSRPRRASSPPRPPAAWSTAPCSFTAPSAS